MLAECEEPGAVMAEMPMILVVAMLLIVAFVFLLASVATRRHW